MITVNYIHKPVGGPDSELNVKVVPIIIHWQPELVKNVLQFFDIKEDAAKSGLVPVQEAARVVLNSVEQQAKVGLIYAIESRISVFLNIEASAPIFVIPNPDSETNLVINMGKLTVKSDLGERNLSDMSIEDLEKAAYDRYTVSVSEAQMYIEDSIQNDVILEKIGFTVYLANCIVPERRLTKFKIDGSSKQLKMDLSERKITIIQQAIRIINNSFERGTEYVTEIPWSGPGLDLSNEERKVTLDGRLLEAHFEIGLLSLDLSSFNQKHITLGLSSIQLSALVDCNTFVRVSAETFGNYQNILNSHWEPFLEEVQVFARLDIIEGATNVEIDIPKRLELNLSKIFIDIAQNWRVGTKSAESTSQLIFRNRTGCLVTISSGNHEISLNHDSEIEWPTRFIEKVSMKFGDSLDSINDIYLEKIGVQPYFFPGKRIEPLNRCNVTVQILDAIKFITISSVYAFYNSTTDNIEIARMDEKAVIDLTTVYPGKMFNFGIQDWFQNLFVLRPSSKFNWSNPINWKEFSAKSGRQTLNFSSTDQLLKHTVSLSVKNHGSDNPFCLINACAPIMLENLLPYSLNYLLTDASTSKSDKPLLGNLDSGQIIGITSICPEGDLELNLSIPKLRLKTQKSVRIAQKSGSKAKKEIILFDDDEKSITLRLSYSEIDAISKQITISCPYLVFNRSDVSLIFGYKSNFRIEEVAVGIPLESSGAQYSQQPILFSFPNYRPVGSRSYLKVRDGGWSDPVSFEAINTSYLVKVPVSDQLSKQVAITVIPGTGRYAMSNLIYCDPRFVIWNKTAFTIYLRHATTKRGLTIDPGQKLSVTEVENNSEFFQFRIDGYQWTNPFEIKNLGTIHIAVSSLSKERRLFKVSIDISGSTLFVTVDLCEIWPFQLENNTKKWFVYYQRGQNTNYNLPPNEKNVYSWDSLSEPEKLLVLHYEGVECAIDLKNVEKKIIIGDSKGKNEIIVSLALNPETTILTVNDAESAPARELQTKNQNDVSKVVSSIKINVEGLGISCVNENAEEFIYFSAKHLEFISQEFLRQFLYSASIKWFQLDNQSDVGTSEVVIYPTMLSSKDATENDKPVFFTSLLQYKDSKACVQSFKLFTILLQELSLDIDSDFLEMIFKVFMFAPSTESNLQSSKVTKAPSLEFPETCEKATKLYFDSFLLQPMKFNISYSQISTINLGANNRKSRNEIIGFAVDLLSHTAGNIHDAQIKLNALVLNHLSWTTDELFKSLAEFYTKQFLAQLHHILGSSDLLGNPVGLFSNVSSGVKNMFYDPIVGFEITNPAKFGIDVAAGTSNLLKKTLFGLTDSVAKVTGSVAQGLSVLTLDSNYQRKRQNAKRNKPKHLGQGLTKGAKSFARGIASGVSGIVTNPRDDVKKHGAVGVMSGVGKGLFGLVSKPVVGAVDFATDVVDGFKNTTTLGEQEIGRIRPKRYIGKDKVLLVIDINKPYNETLARISEMLTKIDNGKYSNEGLVSHIDLNDEENRSQSNIASNKTLVPKDANLNVLVLTEKRILLVTGSKVEAHIPLEGSGI